MREDLLLRRVLILACYAFVLVPALGEHRLFTVLADNDFPPVSAEELKMTSEPLAPGALAVILYRQVDRNDRDDAYEDNYVRIKVLKDEGRKYANVEIPFVKGRDDVKNVRARSIRPDGAIVNFDGNILEQSIVKAKGISVLSKTFALPDVQVGSIIEYSFQYDLGRQLYNSRWILSSNLFTKHAKFSLAQNNRFSLSWVWNHLPPGTPQPKREQNNMIRLEANNIPAFQAEDFMPPENELKSRVDFIYSTVEVLPAPDEFWKKTGKSWNYYLDEFIGKHKAMEKAVEQIVSPNDPPEVKLRKLYDRVQQIRNRSFELSKTVQEVKRDKEKPTENVEDVWKRGYGNVTTLNWLYLALVRAAGFEAYGCWISDRREYFFRSDTMQSAKLDRNVVLVKLAGKDLYFDPGEEFTPFGTLYWTLTGVEGLRLDKDGGTWIRTTIPESSESKIEHKAKLKLSEAGDLEGRVTVTYTGLDAMRYRFEALHLDDVARKKLLEDDVRSQIAATAEAELTNQPDWKSSEAPLIAQFSLKVSGWSSNAGRRVILPVGLFAASEKHMFEHAHRVHPIYFQYPYAKADDISIELPLNRQVNALPKTQDMDGKVVTYSLRAESDKQELHLIRRLNVDILLLDVKYYESLRDFFQQIRAADEEQILLQPSAADASH